MSEFLTTFSGKYGDILWSLATVKRLSETVRSKVDFACMPQYKDLLPLIQSQPYIDKAFVYEKWYFFHSNYGDQPWNPPAEIEAGYKQCWHLGYRSHPGKTFGNVEMQLIDFIAWQQGISFNGADPLPFLYADPDPYNLPWPKGTYLTCAFNEQYLDIKKAFYQQLEPYFPGRIIPISMPWLENKHTWKEALRVIDNSAAFVGCRSANYVLAQGLKKRMYIFEPHPARNANGHLGFVFGCKYGLEIDAGLNMPPAAAAAQAAQVLGGWLNENA